MEDNLAIDRGLENGTAFFEFGAEGCGVNKIAVVGNGQLAAGGIDEKGLGVFEIARAGRRVAHMADRTIALESFQIAGLEDLGDEAHAFVGTKRLAVPSP